jgi:hypothetical protein
MEIDIFHSLYSTSYSEFDINPKTVGVLHQVTESDFIGITTNQGMRNSATGTNLQRVNKIERSLLKIKLRNNTEANAYSEKIMHEVLRISVCDAVEEAIAGKHR